MGVVSGWTDRTVQLKVIGTLQSSTVGVRLGDSYPLPPILSIHIQYSSLKYTCIDSV